MQQMKLMNVSDIAEVAAFACYIFVVLCASGCCLSRPRIGQYMLMTSVFWHANTSNPFSLHSLLLASFWLL